MKKLLILILLLCTSCSALPAEERAFAVALCVERSEGIWQVYARIPTYQTGGGYQTMAGEGETLEAALAALDAAAPMHLHLSQLRLLTLHRDLGSEMSAVLHTLSDRMDVRPDCAVAVTEIQGKTLMEALVPATGTRLSKSIDVLLETRVAQGRILRSTLADVIRMGDRQTPVAAGLTVTDGKLDLSGGYALADIAEPLTGKETAFVSLLRGDTKTLRLSLPGGTAEVRDAKARIQLDGMEHAKVALTLTTVSSSFTSEGLEKLLAGELLDLLERLSKSGCDVLGLGRRAIMRMDDMAQWDGVNWPEKCRKLRWTVSVGIQDPA